MAGVLLDFVVITSGATLGCLFGIYISETIIRKQRRKQIDKHVEEILEKSTIESKPVKDGVGLHINMRV